MKAGLPSRESEKGNQIWGEREREEKETQGDASQIDMEEAGKQDKKNESKVRQEAPRQNVAE